MSARSVILLIFVLCMLHDLSLFAHNIEAKRTTVLGGLLSASHGLHETASSRAGDDKHNKKNSNFDKYFYKSMEVTKKSYHRDSNFEDFWKKATKAQSKWETTLGQGEPNHIKQLERFKRQQHYHIQLTPQQQQQQQQQPPEIPKLGTNFAHDLPTTEHVNASNPSASCFHTYKARHGIIQTPNFPHKFQTPCECVWVIDTTELPASGSANRSIFIYLTQLYVLGGLKFTEYMYYSDDYKVPSHRAFTLNEDDVTQVAWVQFTSQYLEIRFTMTTLDGTHLRALDRLLDVYGFNITYEVQDKVKPFQCNTLQCRFLGHCYAEREFRSYYCSCFAGFSGSDCGHGPLCDDPHTNVCRNGGICKHIGDAAITCHCPAGYKGTKCEIPDINEQALGCLSKYSSDCPKQCNMGKYFNGSSPLKSVKNSGRNGKTRYEVTIRLGENLTNFYRNSDKERRPGDHLPSLLERHLMRALRNFNITKVSDLELISNSTDRLDITFHFFGIKGDSNRIREAITRMVERGRIGNITLVSNYHLFDENPPLNLLEMTISPNSSIRENNEFIISCTAQGSPRMQFQWFKDGAPVNTTKSIRQMWTSVLPPENRNTFTAILGVKKSKSLDEGIYTCMVTDWDVEQCLSLHVHIKSPPRLRVDPASVTLHRGDSLRVRCLSPGNDDIKRYAQLGYSWTRNGVLFQSNPATAMWEDLYPDGSILKINNIQKSAEYSCVVSNTVKPVFKSVYITVIDRNSVHVCHTETMYQVRWPTSAPGAAIITECPKGYQGHARRVCEQRDADNSNWLQPDFATCIQDKLLEIYNEFLALAAGYQKTDVPAIIKEIFHFTARTYKKCLPGEAGFIIDMLQEIDSYLQLKGTQLEREMAMEIILHILDKIMQNTNSLNNQQQIKKLQLLTQSVALNRETIAASQLAISTGYGGHHQAPLPPYSTSLQSSLSSSSSSSSVTESDVSTMGASASSSSSSSSSTIGVSRQQQQQQQYSTAIATDTLLRSADVGGDTGAIFTAPADNSLSLDSLNSLRIYMTSVKSLPFNLRIYGDDLFTDKLYMDIGLSPHLLSVMTNSTIFASVISYKNLNGFLPKTYFTRGNDPRGSDYILASRIIQTWLFQSNRSNDYRREPLDLPFESGHVEIIFQHESSQQNGDWVPICGCEHKASFESNWRTDLCITKNLMENLTRCVCPISGTYVVLLTKRNANETVSPGKQGPMFVIISCGSCFLQAFFAFLVLFPIWYNRKCAITFLKMQFCFSTSSNMVIYLLGFLKMLPENWHPIVSSSLASLLLLGVSTLIAIALVIHTDLMSKKLYQPAAVTSTITTSTTTTTTNINTMKSQQTKMDSKSIKATPMTTPTTTVATPPTPPTTTTSTPLHNSPPNETQIINNNSNSNSNSNSNRSLNSVEGTTNVHTKPLRCSAMAMAMTMTKTGAAKGASQHHHHPPTTTTMRSRNDYRAAASMAGIKAAIGISWLLPLLFAISSPLICNIIGKWPQNWWLEMSTSFVAHSEASNVRSGGDYMLQQQQQQQQQQGNTPEPLLHNGDNNVVALMRPDEDVRAGVGTERATTANTFDTASMSSWPIYQHNRDEYYVGRSTHSYHLTATTTTTTYDTNASSYYDEQATHDAYTDEGNEAATEAEAAATSLNFIIFICVYVLFISLFCALFVILIKKLLWLLHKNQRGSSEQHTLPHDKNNVAQMRSLRLLYRSGYLLVMKLSTDALFVAYVNRSAPDSQLCYPFGVSCILLGFTIVYSFVLRSETTATPTKGAAGKRKHDTSKMSLSDNFCTGGIIGGSPSLNFYASHEKEKPSDNTMLVRIPPPPQQIEMSTSMQLPLPVISQAPRYQMVVKPTAAVAGISTAADVDIVRHGHHAHHHRNDGHHSVIVESCLVSSNKVQPSSQPRNLDNSPGIGCCNILNTSGGNGGSYASASSAGAQGGSGRQKIVQEAYGYTLASTYEPPPYGQMSLQQQQQQGLIGVDKLDILEGVTTDSTIIGIRSTNQQFSLPYNQSQYDSDHQRLATPNRICRNSSSVDTKPTTATATTATATTTISVTTQTPKVQKRVTITEPTTHTFDPMLPTMVVVAAAAAAATAADESVNSLTGAYNSQAAVAATPTLTPTPPPTITITCSPIDDPAAVDGNSRALTTKCSDESPTTDDENSSMSGMLDRITHDLDYLLNRTTDGGADDSTAAVVGSSSPTQLEHHHHNDAMEANANL